MKRMENYRDNNTNDDIFYDESSNSLLKARVRRHKSIRREETVFKFILSALHTIPNYLCRYYYLTLQSIDRCI